MSEYQYYEFQAIDRLLSAKEMSELRSHSTRARITPTSFVNDYSWGSFKGDEDKWMERYFDAFMYYANWGTHILKLRMHSSLLDAKTANEYCSGDSVFVREKVGRVVLSFISEDQDVVAWDEDEWNLSSLILVRAELARGDLRALYLGWLLCVQNGDFDDEEVEPLVPPGLGQLSASLESLAAFLDIDRDLLEVAAQASPSLERSTLDREDVRGWIAKLPAKEKDELLTNLVIDGDHVVGTERLRKLLKGRSTGPIDASPPRRSVGELLRLTEASATERRRIEAEKRALENVRREHEMTLAREKHLDSLASHLPELWDKVESLIATKQPRKYDEAINILIDLRDLDTRTKCGDFRFLIAELRRAHARKPAFIERLNTASLGSEDFRDEVQS
ncbi:MAG TPA: hypothetical protein VI837_10675 [Blastocatellia bacterium]|nr:hypothetical protein [Blastocatellia bacterium]